MKASNRQYAQSLFEATAGQSEAALKESLHNFINVLAANGHLGRAEAIMSEFEKVWQAEEGLVEADVVSADRLEAETLDLLKAYVSEQTGAKKVHLKHRVDNSLLAGFILRYGDQVLDGSAANMIGNLKKELIK